VLAVLAGHAVAARLPGVILRRAIAGLLMLSGLMLLVNAGRQIL